ncbi:MAG: hypothetical protein V8S93_12945 [Lachnospiraceae bacterium]
MTGDLITDDKNSVEANKWAYMVADKSGNVQMMNETQALKILDASWFASGPLKFTVKEESLDLGLDRVVDLSMVMGSLQVVEDPYNLGQKYYSIRSAEVTEVSEATAEMVEPEASVEPEEAAVSEVTEAQVVSEVQAVSEASVEPEEAAAMEEPEAAEVTAETEEAAEPEAMAVTLTIPDTIRSSTEDSPWR